MMQSERGDDGGGSDEMRQNRRLKPLQGDQQQQPPPQPQKCPRCESLNTKFCYYNNYSLSQPRYFCKTCRRYWTQGGTLRNVPVGGGCRKGKRTKTSSSGESSSSQPNPPQNYTAPQTMGTSSSAITSIPVVLRTEESGVPSMGSYYQGGGFLSSLAAIQSLQPPQPFNQHVSLGGGGGGGGDLGGSSNLGMLQGFNVHVPSFGPNQQTNQQRQFYQMGADRDKTSTVGLIYPPDQQERLMMQSSRPSASSSSQHNWHQNFINDTKPNVSDTTIWSTVSTSTGSHSNNTTATTAGSSSTSLNPNQWPPHFPGYGAPP